MGNTQQYCEKCKKIRKRERGQAYFYRKNPDAKPKEKCTEPCCICGASFASYFEKKPYCNKHWQSVYRYGTPFGKQREKTCKFIKEQDVLKIITKQGDIILADKQDAPLLTPHSWCVSKTGYAVARINKKTVRMHRLILGLAQGEESVVDHKNGNTLDNRRENIRVCNRSQNMRNVKTSKNNKCGHLGISKFGEKYRVRIVADRVEHHIGYYETIGIAIEARHDAEDKYHGEFASHKNRQHGGVVAA